MATKEAVEIRKVQAQEENAKRLAALEEKVDRLLLLMEKGKPASKAKPDPEQAEA